MVEREERPPGVECHCTERSVIARYVPTDGSCHAVTVPDALTWPAAVVALHTVVGGTVDDPERFLAEIAADVEV